MPRSGTLSINRHISFFKKSQQIKAGYEKPGRSSRLARRTSAGGLRSDSHVPGRGAFRARLAVRGRLLAHHGLRRGTGPGLVPAHGGRPLRGAGPSGRRADAGRRVAHAPGSAGAGAHSVRGDLLPAPAGRVALDQPVAGIVGAGAVSAGGLQRLRRRALLARCPDAGADAGAAAGASGCLIGRLEDQRRRVDAVAQARGRRAVGKHVPEVSPTGGTVYFDPVHAQAVVVRRLHVRRIDRCVKARPAGAGVVLRLRREERQSAPGTPVNARLLMIPVCAGEGRLGAMLPQNAVLLRRQQSPPFSFGARDLLNGHCPKPVVLKDPVLSIHYFFTIKPLA